MRLSRFLADHIAISDHMDDDEGTKNTHEKV